MHSVSASGYAGRHHSPLRPYGVEGESGEVVIETYEIWVLLSTDFGKTFMGYDETAPYEQAAQLPC